MYPSSSASFKRARLPGSRNQRPSCLVDGCTADLGKCRDYHRRHKVCEVHSKTSKVIIRGQEQRFCQQCSRFHSLVEFDEGKRSCRKRLDGHNRRRRKPQPDCLSINSGFRHAPFISPQAFAAPAVTSSWLRTLKPETDTSSISELNFDNQNGFFRGSFMQTNYPSLSGVSVCQPFLDANHSSSNGCISSQAIDSDRARSLLSSQQYTGLVMESEQVGTISGTDGGSNIDLHGHEMFRTRRPGSLSAIGAHQTVSSWDE